MVRTISKKLQGGRSALYRGQNAYASQTFENDTRAQITPAFACLYLDAATTYTAGTTIITWSPINVGRWKNINLYGFALNSNHNGVVAQRDGTYKISWGFDATSVPHGATISAQIVFTPQNSIYAVPTGVLDYINNGGSDVSHRHFFATPLIVDLAQGTLVQFQFVYSGSVSSIIIGNNTGSTGMLIEQINL